MVAEVEGREARGRGCEAWWKGAEVEGHRGQVEAARGAGWHVCVVDGEVAVGIRVGAGWRDVCGIEDVVVDEIHLIER